MPTGTHHKNPIIRDRVIIFHQTNVPNLQAYLLWHLLPACERAPNENRPTTSYPISVIFFHMNKGPINPSVCHLDFSLSRQVQKGEPSLQALLWLRAKKISMEKSWVSVQMVHLCEFFVLEVLEFSVWYSWNWLHLILSLYYTYSRNLVPPGPRIRIPSVQKVEKLRKGVSFVLRLSSHPY